MSDATDPFKSIRQSKLPSPNGGLPSVTRSVEAAQGVTTRMLGRYKTTAAKIRHLHLTSPDLPLAEISRRLGIPYQQVRNTLKQELKRGPHEPLLPNKN